MPPASLRSLLLHALLLTFGTLCLATDADAADPPSCTPADRCCRICTTGKACGKTCIAESKTCHVGRGCACNAEEVCAQ